MGRRSMKVTEKRATSRPAGGKKAVRLVKGKGPARAKPAREQAPRKLAVPSAARGPRTVNFQRTLSTDTSLLAVCDPVTLRHRIRDKKNWWEDEKLLHREAVRGHLIPVHTGADGIFNLRVTTGRLTAHETEYKEEERSGYWIDLRSGRLLLCIGEDFPGEGKPLAEDPERETRLHGGRYSATITRIEEVDDDLPTFVVRLTPLAAAVRPPELPQPASAFAEGDQESDYEKVEKMIEAGDLEGSERICDSYLARESDEHSYDFRALRARVRRERGDLDGAFTDIQAAIEDFPFGERIAEYAHILYARGQKEEAMDAALWAILDNYNEYPLVLEVRAMRMRWLIAEGRITEAQVHMGAIREDRAIMSPRSEPKLFAAIDRLRAKIRSGAKPRFTIGSPTIEILEEDLVGTVRHKLEINGDKPWKQLELLMIGCRLGGIRTDLRKQRDDLAARLIKVKKS